MNGTNRRIYTDEWLHGNSNVQKIPALAACIEPRTVELCHNQIFYPSSSMRSSYRDLKPLNLFERILVSCQGSLKMACTIKDPFC